MVVAFYADLVINELYEKPLIKGNNIIWGHKYFLRDEFLKSKPKKFSENTKVFLLHLEELIQKYYKKHS